MQKAPLPASKFIKKFDMPADVSTVILHTRFATVGAPERNINNHPIPSGTPGQMVVGTHNGNIVNTWQLEYDYDLKLNAQVDSEVLFAMLAQHGDNREMWKDIHGGYAIAWLREGQPNKLNLMRGVGYPLWVMETSFGLVYASTREALQTAIPSVGEPLIGYMESEEGRIIRVDGGYIVDTETVEVAPERDNYWSNWQVRTNGKGTTYYTPRTNEGPRVNAYFKGGRRTWLGTSALDIAKLVGIPNVEGHVVDSCYGQYTRVSEKTVDFRPYVSIDILDAIVDDLQFWIQANEKEKKAVPESMRADLNDLRTRQSKTGGRLTIEKLDPDEYYIEDGKVFSVETGETHDPYTLPAVIEMEGRRYYRAIDGKFNETSSNVFENAKDDYIVFGSKVYQRTEGGSYEESESFDDDQVGESVKRTAELVLSNKLNDCGECE